MCLGNLPSNKSLEKVLCNPALPFPLAPLRPAASLRRRPRVTPVQDQWAQDVGAGSLLPKKSHRILLAPTSGPWTRAPPFEGREPLTEVSWAGLCVPGNIIRSRDIQPHNAGQDRVPSARAAVTATIGGFEYCYEYASELMNSTALQYAGRREECNCTGEGID